VAKVALRHSATRSQQLGGYSMGIVGIVVVVLIVLFVLGYFGRGRFRA
jgi:small-conductance mechanosensitive channel